jgi:hypothetical protein
MAEHEAKVRNLDVFIFFYCQYVCMVITLAFAPCFDRPSPLKLLTLLPDVVIVVFIKVYVVMVFCVYSENVCFMHPCI